jgi:hypothetical protein
MILEYRGEVIRRPVADRREEQAKQVIMEKAAAAAAAANASSAGASAGMFDRTTPPHPPVVSAGELAEASTYMFTVDPSSGLIVDATKKGNIARFVNHCCEPNCVTRSVTLEVRSSRERVGVRVCFPFHTHSTPLHSTPLHSTPLHSTPLHSTPLHSTPLHSIPLHSAMNLTHRFLSSNVQVT